MTTQVITPTTHQPPAAMWIDDITAPTQTATETPSNAPGASRESALRAAREAHKLEKRLCRQVGQAIIDFNMIEEGDRIMVCMSGGKDSYGMLDILLKMK